MFMHVLYYYIFITFVVKRTHQPAGRHFALSTSTATEWKLCNFGNLHT